MAQLPGDDRPVEDQAAFAQRIVGAHAGHPYGLGYFAPDKEESGQRSPLIKWDIRLRAEDFERYCASTVPYARMTQRRSYQLLTRAAYNLRQTVQLYSNVYKVGGQYRGLDGHQVALALTGAVTDWLTYSFIYLLTEENFLTHLGPEELAIFKSATNDAYDTYPAYRFLYQLRNYAHHSGPPLAALDMTAGEGGWDVAIVLDKRQLLGGGFDWNQRSKEVMDILPDKFSIMPLIDQAMRGYELIEDRTMAIYLKYVESWLEVAEEALEALGPYEGHPCIFAVRPDEKKSMQVLGGAVGMVPLMTQECIDHVKWALGQPDPIAAVRVQRETVRGFTPDNIEILRATQAMASLIAGGEQAALDQVSDIIEANGGPAHSLVIGFMDVLRVNLFMLGRMFNAPPENFPRLSRVSWNLRWRSPT